MSGVEIHNPKALVSCDWLERHLDDFGLRIFDCTTQLVLEEGGDRPYRVVSCQEEHNARHIPGAGYFELQRDFSRNGSPFGMTLAEPDQVARSFAGNGVGNGTRVILYSRRGVAWATRFWWMLRWLGFDNAAVLDGGFDKWVADGRATSSDPCAYPPNELMVNLRPNQFVGKEDVLTAIGDPATCTLNALGTDIFTGENPRYGRPGRIPGSASVPQISLLNPETFEFLAADLIAEKFAAVGADQAAKHITYCGGGIFATVVAFWLHQLGHDTVSVYDNSMSEWGPDESLPVERD